jgi:hypothetical protein
MPLEAGERGYKGRLRKLDPRRARQALGVYTSTASAASRKSSIGIM